MGGIFLTPLFPTPYCLLSSFLHTGKIKYY
jgi:hypothetical protein